jgi:hypothetical protein
MSIGLFPPLDYDFHPVSLTVLPEHRLRLTYDKRVLEPKRRQRGSATVSMHQRW